MPKLVSQARARHVGVLRKELHRALRAPWRPRQLEIFAQEDGLGGQWQPEQLCFKKSSPSRFCSNKKALPDLQASSLARLELNEVPQSPVRLTGQSLAAKLLLFGVPRHVEVAMSALKPSTGASPLKPFAMESKPGT